VEMGTNDQGQRPSAQSVGVGVLELVKEVLYGAQSGEVEPEGLASIQQG